MNLAEKQPFSCTVIVFNKHKSPNQVSLKPIHTKNNKIGREKKMKLMRNVIQWLANGTKWC